jgi:small-conductance mechanosensitive channel
MGGRRDGKIDRFSKQYHRSREWLAGSDPNGDLLNQHLVNWTHDNSNRSVDIPVSVAFGTDLGKAIQILKHLPEKDERVLSSPAPSVIIKQL